MAIDPRLKARYISSARAKVARADEHLAALYRETDAWGERDPFRITRQSHANGRIHEFRAYFKVQPDVWRWAVLLGDALHNLRCALDHMVYALAIHQTGLDPPDDDRHLAYPITATAQDFAKAKWHIRSLNENARAAVEKTQPYNRLKPGQWFMPVWWLAQLNDIDKHRLAHLAPFAARPDDIAIDAEPGTYTAQWNMAALKEGTPFFVLTLTEPDPNVYVDLKATAAVVIDAPPYPAIGLHHTAEAIRREVVLICRYLSKFF